MAQTTSPLAYWQYSAGEALAPLGGPVPDWRVTLGLGTMAQPQWDGSRRYRVTPSAIIDIRWRDIAFLSDGEGLGVNLLRGRTYRAGLAIAYDIGRDIHDSRRLATLDSVDPAPEIKAFGEVFVLPVVLSAALRRGIGGHDGLIGDVGAYVPIPLHGETLILFIGPGASFADARYMQSYFGVRPSQASAALRPFTPGGGLKSAGLGATAVWLIDDHWLLESDIAFKRLLGDAARSPVTEVTSEVSFGINIGYRF